MNPWFDDMFLLRFCRARKFQMKKLTLMWANLMEWRKKHGIDTIMQDHDFPERA